MSSLSAERRVAALADLSRLWQDRLASGWTPPPGSGFSWPMIRLSLAALLPGMSASRDWLDRSAVTLLVQTPTTVPCLARTPTPVPSLASEGGESGGVSVCGCAPEFVLCEAADGSVTRLPSFACEGGDGGGCLGETGDGGGSPAETGNGTALGRAAEGTDAPARRESGYEPPVVALILAGNTPLLAWPPLCACLLAGCAVFVKMSRDETLWPRLFVESLAVVDADLAATILLDTWPGEDARTRDLVAAADAVIAYGGDAALAALRQATPVGVPFFGFGHALSVAAITADALPLNETAARGFARDMLLYDQGGCLSPHALFVEGDAAEAGAVARALAAALPGIVDELEIPPVNDSAVARAVRQARDLALFSPGTAVQGDPALRWTVIAHDREIVLEEPIGHGVMLVAPLADLPGGFGRALGAARGRISAVGVAGKVWENLKAVLAREGVSRICGPGEMQTPPLDWANGGVDLLSHLLRVRQT